MRVGGSHVDPARLEQVAPRGFLDLQVRLPGEDLGQVAAVVREQVQDDDHGRVEIRREPAEHIPERDDATGRGDEPDGMARCSIRPPHSGLRAQPG